MRYLLPYFMVFFLSHSFGQSLPIKELVNIYNKDSFQLQNYFDSINYQYLKFYGNKTLEFVNLEWRLERWFTDSNKVIKNEIASIDDIHPILFYEFNDIQELNDCKKNILGQGFILDSIKTTKLNTNKGDSIECYILGDVEVQLSDNDFKKGIKFFNGTAPMSVFSGQDVHLYSIIIGSKEY